MVVLYVKYFLGLRFRYHEDIYIYIYIQMHLQFPPASLKSERRWPWRTAVKVLGFYDRFRGGMS